MKIYLAGPMAGIPNYNFPAFNAAAEKLRQEGHEVFNPAAKPEEAGIVTAPNDGSQLNLEKLRVVLEADTRYICRHAEAIAMLPGWERSYGARAEWALANALGLKVIYL